MELTKQKITVGRVLHMYSDAWTGPRPAIVVNASLTEPNAQVNIQLDGYRDTELLAVFRARGPGNTFTVPVADVDDHEGVTDQRVRRYGFDSEVGYLLAVWPPRV